MKYETSVSIIVVASLIVLGFLFGWVSGGENSLRSTVQGREKTLVNVLLDKVRLVEEQRDEARSVAEQLRDRYEKGVRLPWEHQQ